MAKRPTDVDRGTEPRETDPPMGTEDRVEEVRGTADGEGDEFEDEGEEDELEDEDEADEGTF